MHVYSSRKCFQVDIIIKLMKRIYCHKTGLAHWQLHLLPCALLWCVLLDLKIWYTEQKCQLMLLNKARRTKLKRRKHSAQRWLCYVQGSPAKLRRWCSATIVPTDSQRWEKQLIYGILRCFRAFANFVNKKWKKKESKCGVGAPP